MKRNVMILMILLLAVSWYVTVSGTRARADEYEQSIELAASNDEKGMYEAAIDNYRIALKYHPDDVSLKKAIADDYLKLGNKTSFVSECKEIIENNDGEEEAFGRLMDYYKSEEKYSDALPYLHKLMENYPDRDYIKEAYNSMKGAYKEGYNVYDYVGDFFEGYVSCASGEGLYGAASDKDSLVINMDYAWSGPYSSELGAAPVMTDDGSCAYVNKKGNKILVPDFDTSYLGVLHNDIFIAREKDSGKFRYLKKDLSEASGERFDDATTFFSSAVAVKRGDKWALLNQSFEPATDYEFDDVVMDSNRIATRNGVLWVKRGERYQLVNRKGEAVTEAVYEDARPFASREAAAAKKNGKWGFVSAAGEELGDFIYEDALSFCSGFAPIKTGDRWSYIDEEGRVCIDGEFTGAGTFSSNGSAFVQRDSSYWILITLIDKQ